jgi:uncharacterized protein
LISTAGSEWLLRYKEMECIAMSIKQNQLFLQVLLSAAFISGCVDDSGDEEIDSASEGDSENDGGVDSGVDGGVESTCTFRESPLPQPNGPYCIGTKDYHFVDPDRGEPFTPDDDDDTREVAVRIFYPAATDTETPYGEFFSEKTLEVIVAEMGIPDFEEALEAVPVQFRPNAPMADADEPFPLLVYSPGFGMTYQESTSTLEDMASRGYIVAAINHPYFSRATEFPDGRVVTVELPEDYDEAIALIQERFHLLVGDMQLVLDKLTALSDDDLSNLLTGHMDMDNVGAFGHSIGGAAALGLIQEDDRVKAGIDVDGSVGFPVMTMELLEAPVMFHLAGSHTMRDDGSIRTFWDRVDGAKYAVSVADAGHSSYTDWPALVATVPSIGTVGEEYQGTIDAVEMLTLVRAYNSAFFDVYLKGEDVALLTDLEAAYPDATVMEADDPPVEMPTQSSSYLEMQDGTQIAVDLWLPADADEENPVPAVIRATRYWRDIDVINPYLIPMTESEMEAYTWTDAGYALVLVDVRGSGASFGEWRVPWSEEEVADLGEVVEWITEQTWSDGKVGAQGISYDGNTSDFIGLLESDAVQIVAPRFSDWNIYTDIAFPGGIINEGFLEAWSLGTQILDANDVCAANGVNGEACESLKQVMGGVRPVDGDEDYTLLDAAVAEHADNFDVYEASLSAPYLDSPLGGTSYINMSPAGYVERLGSDAPAYLTQASWNDAATAHGALSRYMASENAMVVYVGAWSHGGEYDTDPFLDADMPASPSYAEQVATTISVFDAYMKAEATAIERVINYYTLGEGEWRTTSVWPPEGVVETPFYLASDGALVSESPTAEESATDYPVDYSASTGFHNRWWTQYGGGDVVYPDRAEEDQKLLVFTSEPTTSELRIAGHPEVLIHLSSTHEDGAVYIYLEDVSPEGKVTYLSEGQLRLIHRKISDDPPPWHLFGPYHSYLEADAAPMIPGEAEAVAIMLQPIAALIETGHAIRIAVAGHDASNFMRLPESGAPTLTIHHDATHPSRVTLPIIE